MSFSESMDSQEVRSVMTRMKDEVSKEDVCLKPSFDLKYLFTVNSEVDDPKTKSQYSDGQYGSCSAFTGDQDGITHTCEAVKRPKGGPWGPVPGASQSIEEYHPINHKSFSLGASLTTETVPGDYTLRAGPWVLDLKGEPYSVMTGMSIQEFAYSEYLNRRMSIFGVDASDVRDDPRFEMTEKSLDAALGISVASCPSVNGTSTSDK